MKPWPAVNALRPAERQWQLRDAVREVRCVSRREKPPTIHGRGCPHAVQHRHDRLLTELWSRVDSLHPIYYLYTMALNIKDPQTEALAAEVAALANETKTQAVRTALQERKERLQARKRRQARAQRLDRFLEAEAWPQLPEAVLGRPVPKAEREAILGYRLEGV
jgi:antitoxin VapB